MKINDLGIDNLNSCCKPLERPSKELVRQLDILAVERRQCEGQGATGYWMPTRDNAIRPLYQLVAMAMIRPDGVWDGD